MVQTTFKQLVVTNPVRINFTWRKKQYQYIATVYDTTDFGTNTVVVVYDYKKQSYGTIQVTANIAHETVTTH